MSNKYSVEVVDEVIEEKNDKTAVSLDNAPTATEQIDQCSNPTVLLPLLPLFNEAHMQENNKYCNKSFMHEGSTFLHLKNYNEGFLL